MRFIVFLLFISISLKAQESDTVLPRILLLANDTERVNQLYTRGFALRNTDPQLSFYYAKLSEQTAKQAPSDKHLAKSYNLLGVLYYKKGNYRTALNYHLQALKLRQSCGDVLGMAHSQTNLGNVYADLKLFEKAEDAYLQAIDAYKKANAHDRIASCLLNIGALKHQQKHYDQAIENYKLAESMADANDYNTRAIFLTNMAQAYMAKGEIEKCISLNEDALKLRIMADNTLETADNYLNIGSAYIGQNDLVRAKYYLDTAWSIAERNAYFELTYEACKTYALYYSQSKNFEAAFSWQQKYNNLKDTLMAQQAAAKEQVDFNDLVKTEPIEIQQASINNPWLLVIIFGLAIFIPLSLARFKR